MTEWHGWAGTVLDVDLSNGKLTRVPLSPEHARKYVGGLGFASRILYDEVGPDVDPLGPQNLIIIAPGTLGGTLAPASGRCDIVSKSPLTGIFVRSNLGGFFAPELKQAGYDLIVIRGQSPRPVYLQIHDDTVELRDASRLWGQDTWQTERLVRQEFGDPDAKTLKIGPAGEHLSFCSAVIGDLGRAAARCSVGAVWGAKKLKAVVVRGTRGVRVAHPEELLQLTVQLWRRMPEDPLYKAHVKYGTNYWVGDPNISRAARAKGRPLPDIMAAGLYRYYDRNLSCAACALHCSRFYNIKTGKYAGTAGEGIEGSIQLQALGFDVDDGAFMCHYNNLCNKLGVCTTQAGGAITWAMGLYRDGVITREDTAGVELAAGNQEAILTMVTQMALKQGFGAVLDGFPRRAAQQIGRGAEMHVSHGKGLGSRGPGMMNSLKTTLAYALSTRGWDHLVGSPPNEETPGWIPEMTDEVLRKIGRERYGDPDMFHQPVWGPSPRHARRIYDHENLFATADMTGVCKFAQQYALLSRGLGMSDLAQLLAAATGVPFTAAELVMAAEREMLLERAFNARQGMRRVDDHPYAFWWQLKHGRPHPRYSVGLPVGLEDYGRALDEYYRLRGCDLRTGLPARSKLEEVGLDDIADDMDRMCEPGGGLAR